MENKPLEKRRYYGVISGNVKVNQVVSGVSGSTFLEPPLTTPYTQVVDKVKAHFLQGTEDVQSATQQFRNHISALNGFLAFCGKTTASNVGSEFASQFESNLAAYPRCQNSCRSDRSEKMGAITGV